MKKFKTGVSAWGEIREAILTSMRAGEGLPLMKASLGRLSNALKRLDQLGDVIACVPELAESVRDEKEISKKVREEAQRLGLVLRYD